MEGDRSLHRQRALQSLTKPLERSSSKAEESLSRDGIRNDTWPSSAGVSVGPNNPLGRLAARHPHRSMRLLAATEASRILSPAHIPTSALSPRLPPPVTQDSSWVTRDSDMESRGIVSCVEAANATTRSKRLSTLMFQDLSFWQRLRGEGKRRVSWMGSFRNVATFTWLNSFLVFVPVAFAVEHSSASRVVKFLFSFLAIMPLSKILDYGSEQLSMYCGKIFGDLLVISLNNVVETVLAIILLAKCELNLLQSSVAGVVLLRLLLVPGIAFLHGGAKVLCQDLHPDVSQLNNTLLILGTLTLSLLASFFASLERTMPVATQRIETTVTDGIRDNILGISRGLAVMLIVTYIGSRIYLHKPPGETYDSNEHRDAPAAFDHKVSEVEDEEPIVSPLVCLIVLVIAVFLLAFMAEHLVSNIHGIEKDFDLTAEWFGLILLPLISYSADGVLHIVAFIARIFQRGASTFTSSTLAQGRSIDLAIQFLMFWLPFVVLVGWMVSKPMSLLFNVFEVVVLIAACFIVTFIMVDAKTNWVEGLMMVVFYFMIVVTAWYYPGQADIRILQSCLSVKEAVTREHDAFSAIQAALRQSPIVNYTISGAGHP